MSNPDTPPVPAEMLKSILDIVNAPFWHRGEFWIGTILGALGLTFSVLAFIQAKRAATAAHAAARSVKIQTVTMELQEVSQRLSGIAFDIGFVSARLLLTEASSRIRRHTAPFRNDARFREAIAELRGALPTAWNALNGVRPTDPSKESAAANTVFNAIDSSFSQLVELISELLGLMETETLALGEDNDDAV